MASVYKRGNIYWIAYIIGKKRKCISLKTKVKREALQKVKDFEQKFTGIKISNVLEQWVEENFYKSKRYLFDMRENVNQFITVAGDIPVLAVRREDILNYWKIYMCQKKRYSQSTISIRLRTLRVLFSYCLKCELIERHPFTRIQIPTAKEKTDFLSQDEIKRLLQAAASRPLFSAIIEFLLVVGLRAGELNCLKYQDVKATHIELIGKTGSRTFPLNQDVKEILDKIRSHQSNDPVFVLSNEQGRHLGNWQYINKIIKKYVRKAGLSENYTTHTLRHTFCSQLVLNGIDIYIIKELAGHKSVKMTEKYTHLDPKHIKTKTKYW